MGLIELANGQNHMSHAINVNHRSHLAYCVALYVHRPELLRAQARLELTAPFLLLHLLRWFGKPLQGHATNGAAEGKIVR